MTDEFNQMLEDITIANNGFVERIDTDKLPISTPGHIMVITCMDPRLNLEAIGVEQFALDGGNDSSVRIVRTLGGMSEERSLLLGIHVAGIRHIAVLMHTDCGCSLAWFQAELIMDNLRKNLDQASFDKLSELIGEPADFQRLREYLRAFEDPRVAVKAEVKRIRSMLIVPKEVQVNGFVYDTATGKVDAIVDRD